MVAGGNFADTLSIDAEGKLIAAMGPLIANPGDDLELYVWVVTQDAVYKSELKGKGFANVGETNAQWNTIGADAEQSGTFRAGTGTGIGAVIATTKPGGQVSVTWWATSLTLTQEAQESPQGDAAGP